MNESFSFRLNGDPVTVSGVDPNTTLLAWLRARGLTGSKESCAEGECGACAVVLVTAADAAGAPGGQQAASRHDAVNSCLVLLPEVAGGEVWTVEGVRGPSAQGLHPVQRLLVEHGGSQCGYCTPGFVMSLFASYYCSPRGEPRELLAGNLCRCTGYRPICAAAAALPAPAADDPHALRLSRPAPVGPTLAYAARQARFDRPMTLAEALALRAAHPDATVLAGGTDLVVEHNQDARRFPRVLALGAIAELCRVTEHAEHFVIGAGATWSQIERGLGDRVPMLAQMIPLFGSPLLRARATLGGNLMTASPVGDGAPVLLSLDAEVELASLRQHRTIPLHEFFTGYRRTSLQPDELLVAIRIRKGTGTAPPAVSRFYKVSKRELDDIASVSAAIAVHLDGGRVTQARLAFGGVAATPRRATAAEQGLVGRPLDGEALRVCQEAVRSAFQPIDDVRASARYRTAMLGSLLAKFWSECRGAGHQVAP